MVARASPGTLVVPRVAGPKVPPLSRNVTLPEGRGMLLGVSPTVANFTGSHMVAPAPQIAELNTNA